MTRVSRLIWIFKTLQTAETLSLVWKARWKVTECYWTSNQAENFTDNELQKI
jgi:hypothetical protein